MLWSRLGEYNQRWLDELLYPDRQVFEYWAHAASILPIEHFPLFRHTMLQHLLGETGWWRQWQTENGQVMIEVLDQIRQRGPLGAADFAAPAGHRSGGWWDWKPAKRALDPLWSGGELMIERRVNFHRRYDLRERLLPEWDDTQLPSEDERRRRLAALALQAMGIATVRQLADYFRQKQDGLRGVLDEFVNEGNAYRVQVNGWDVPAYVHHSALPALDNTHITHTTLLSPFDNLIWHRDRTRSLWNFDYTLECYLPGPKRRYGYFTLPILHCGQLVGRLDPKAERRAGIFRVKALYLEPDVMVNEVLAEAIARTLHACAAWHRTPEIILERVEPASFDGLLRAALRNS